MPKHYTEEQIIELADIVDEAALKHRPSGNPMSRAYEQALAGHYALKSLANILRRHGVSALQAAAERERDLILARLSEPDEAVVEAFTAEAHRRGHHYIRQASVSELLQCLVPCLLETQKGK